MLSSMVEMSSTVCPILHQEGHRPPTQIHPPTRTCDGGGGSGGSFDQLF